MSTTQARRTYTRLTGVVYDDYVRIRDAPGNQGLRMAYNDGVLEIMSPQFRHGFGGRRLAHLVVAYCQAFGVAYEDTGTATYRRGVAGLLKGKGKEPDECLFLRDAAVTIRGKETHDLDADPPPSLWVEVDNRGSSRTKLPIYAALGIPEVWRYMVRRRVLWFGRLDGDGYAEIAESDALPGLTPDAALDLLDQAKILGMADWDRWLRDEWFPAHRREMNDGNPLR